MNIRYIPTWLGLLLTLYLVTACDRVYDDLSGCLGNTIVFSYLADDNQEHLQEYVDGIDVFIFDAKGEVLRFSFLFSLISFPKISGAVVQ